MTEQFTNFKTLDEWIRIYEEKTGDKHDVPKGFTMYYIPNRGFAVYSMFKMNKPDDCILVYEVCGDAHFWHDIAVFMAQQNNVRNLMTLCTRNIHAYCRFWGWKINETFNNDAGILARLNGVNQYGRPLTIGVAFERKSAKENEKYAYFCTSEVN